MSCNRIGLYPGTFDPPTAGHLDIIQRALHVVDRLVVGVAVNVGKAPMFVLHERVGMVEKAIEALGVDAAARIEVRSFETLLMKFTKDVETVFLMASEQTQFVSSRLVKEICLLGGDITDFVPGNVKERLLERVETERQKNSNK